MFSALSREDAQQRAYRTLSDDELFEARLVRVVLRPEDLPGYKGNRVPCEQCGESVNFGREIHVAGRTLCRSCSGERYYQTLE